MSDIKEEGKEKAEMKNVLFMTLATKAGHVACGKEIRSLGGKREMEAGMSSKGKRKENQIQTVSWHKMVPDLPR